MIDRDLLLSGAASFGVVLSPDQSERLAWLGEELIRWNKRINLTAISEPKEVVEKHLLDALSIQGWVKGPLVDLGSGAGFPCLPLKIVNPAMPITSLDSVAKKLGFQRHVIRRLALTGFRTVHGRIEHAAAQTEHRHAYQTVVARALADLSALVPLMEPFCAAGGRVLAMKGPGVDGEIVAATPALERYGLVVTEVQRWRLPWSSAERALVVLCRKPMD